MKNYSEAKMTPSSKTVMVPLEVYGGDEEWREAVFAFSKEGQP